MTFRHRITLVATAAVAVAVLIASALTYAFVSDQLHGQIDSSLRNGAGQLGRTIIAIDSQKRGAPLTLPGGIGARALRGILSAGSSASSSAAGSGRLAGLLARPPRAPLGQERGVFELLGANGQVLVAPTSGQGRLPVDPRARTLARHGGASYFTQSRLGSDHLRILAAALPAGTPAHAVLIARSLNEVDHTLANLRLILLLVALGGVAVAALLGALVSRAAVGPVSRLTAAAEHIARTNDLARRIPSRGAGELHRLAVSFNAMLDALEQSMRALDASVRAQRQLVADTSHELRTPVTSVRANIEVLQHADRLSARERDRLLADVVEQLEDLTTLINDVIELARQDEPSRQLEELRFDEIVAEAIERVSLHAPEAIVEQRLQQTVVLGDAARLSRAVKNLLDNALKFAPPGSPVEVELHDGELSVRDHGPGIAADDLPHAFDRFYRGENARALPGSGLGLAIVRRVAEAHGGSVSAQNAPGGGTLIRLSLPALALARQPELQAQRA